MKCNVEPLAGFKDYLGKEAAVKEYILCNIKSTYELYGFEPLDTPAVERKEILEGKYGEEAKQLIYDVFLNGGYKGQLRYDLTVPLARVVARFQHVIKYPYMRYHIGKVYRGERAQVGRGRLREFYQADIDIVGVDSVESDILVILAGISALESVGIPKPKLTVLINNRKIMDYMMLSMFNIPSDKIIGVYQSIDKLDKYPKKDVIRELVNVRGLDESTASKVIEVLCDKDKSWEMLLEIENQLIKKEVDRTRKVIETLRDFGINAELSLRMVRGLNYYDGIIFETVVESAEKFGSVFSGGRYNHLIGIFLGKDIPAVGGSIGVDRFIDILKHLGIYSELAGKLRGKVVMICNLGCPIYDYLNLMRELHKVGIQAFVYPSSGDKLRKQLEYADKKGINFVVIFGNSEREKGVVKIKDMNSRDETVCEISNISKNLKNMLGGANENNQ